MLKTIKALNETYESPYSHALAYPLGRDMPPEERETLKGMLLSLKRQGVPDTVAYLTEEELTRAAKDLETVGYDPDSLRVWSLRVACFIGCGCEADAAAQQQG
ncbi:MAG: hypothetical protein HP490_12690 [Nitrospira sp.]|nr:hypothetical protein [Nitrospira sp.]